MRVPFSHFTSRAYYVMKKRHESQNLTKMASMGGVAELRKAEEQALNEVNEARKDRGARLKQAKAEAE